MRHRSLLAAVIASLALVVTGCGGDDKGSAAADHNQADVEFATGMIPHHAQALHMVEMADDRAGSPEFRRLLSDIEAAQGPEIDEMAGWLDEWGEDVPPTEMPMGPGGDDHGMDGHGMGPDDGTRPGMMGRRDLDRLDAMSRGQAFERMWMRMMIEHHEGAIEMAKTEVADGEYPDAIRLAEDIIEAQEAEIELMEDLLRR